MKTYRYYLPGIVTILMALLIVVFPAILVVFVSTMLILGGLGMLSVAHGLAKTDSRSAENLRSFWDRDLESRPFPGRVFINRWYRM